MSSNSSTSSIRQFGLYRTIDARTEEFLRLSRKRQLRQGCICAAISTAITVIVVIIIILIYEYSNVTNAHNIKPNWLGLMNQSDPLQLDPSHKTKFKLDRTTIQILPLLLKAFTKNKYLDPDVEDSSSPSPNLKDEDTTEKMHKNIFADTRNWMKMPTSRVYAIEFKTSPIVYFKNPTRNLDYFRKIRKIRDYERVMNYVDKMINDKVTSGSTQPMVKTDYNIYEKSKFSETATIPMIKWQTTKPKSMKINNEYFIEPEKQINCSCSSSISLLIRKLMMSLQKMMPDLVNTKVESVKNCTTHTVNTVLESNNHKVNTTKDRHLLKTNRQNETKTQVPNAYLKSDLEKLKKSSKNSSKNDMAISNMLRLLKPNVTYNKNKNINHNLHNYKLFEKKQSTQMENQIKPEKLPKSDDNINLHKSTFERNKSYNSIDHFSNKHNIFENISESTASPVIDDYYEDYTQTDPNDISNIFDILDTHTLELVKNNIISTKSHSYVKKTTPNDQNTFTTEPPQYDFEDYKRNVSDERYVIAMNSFEGNRHMLQNDTLVVLNFNKTTTVKNTEFYSIEEPITHIETKYIPTIKPENNRNELHEDTNRDEALERENDKLEEEMEKSTNEESTEEDFKQMENIIDNFKNDNSRPSKRQKTEPTNSSELYYWEFIKIQEHAKNISKAILSKTRPTYLEMQRNNWKQEETNNIIEYDANINNYIFE
ncbi:arrestin domain-containing protein F-like isoform X1 [Pieris napi]|uniref:arrestin domain-containing protein F-like isoform X1 n=1 Tax=Pieris napi TaxID=78633 RepID=UPI001FB88280|nr:arrestin domain-containing protein F-like isoform X1 [Pieris napi]